MDRRKQLRKEAAQAFREKILEEMEIGNSDLYEKIISNDASEKNHLRKMDVSIDEYLREKDLLPQEERRSFRLEYKKLEGGEKS